MIIHPLKHDHPSSIKTNNRGEGEEIFKIEKEWQCPHKTMLSVKCIIMSNLFINKEFSLLWRAFSIEKIAWGFCEIFKQLAMFLKVDSNLE